MKKQQYLICNCEKTMSFDEAGLVKSLGENADKVHMSLCRAQLAAFENAINSNESLVIACTQEKPLFLEIADEHKASTDLHFVNIRENAGWSKDARLATPKIAALLKNAEFETTPARLKSIQSDGMCLVYGSGQEALDIAKLMSNHLSVTLLLSDGEAMFPPAVADVPIYRGDIVQATGSFGEFEVIVDNYAPLRPASRSSLEFAVARNGATSNCSLILDISGKTPLFPAHSHRDGYAHVDPGSPSAILRQAINFIDMVGEFEKPIYVDYNSETCAHSRSQKNGCNKCLDVCPAGAIADAGDVVEIDNAICGGCGSCHAVCPTGSISYQYPNRADVISRVENILSVYSEAGGVHPVLLLHDDKTGIELISAIARYGDGLPSNVIPLGFHAVTSLGHIELLSMIVNGAAQIRILCDANRQEELSGLEAEVALATAILEGLGLQDKSTIEILSEADPDIIEEKLWATPKLSPLKTAKFKPLGSKRDIARLIFSNLHKASKEKPDFIELPENAPYGDIVIHEEACTLCMACTSACPANAITDTPGEPKLRFTQSACVQCGLCVTTCPEKVLSLKPQLDFTAGTLQPKTLKEEEPFNCISCGVPFAAKSTIERIAEQLSGKHSMFQSEERANLIKMCDNCRIEAQVNSSEDPFVVGSRPKPRTTGDYQAAEKGLPTADDFLIDD